MDYLQFDRDIAKILGRYLGGVYSAETIVQRFFRLHSHVARTRGGHGRPEDQQWVDSLGLTTTLPSVVFSDLEDFAGD